MTETPNQTSGSTIPSEAMTTNQQRVQINVDQRDLKTIYANAFQSNFTPDEIFVSFGINQNMPPRENQDPQILLQLESRVIMNWKTAKQLAIQIGQAVRSHEKRFGEIDIDGSKTNS